MGKGIRKGNYGVQEILSMTLPVAEEKGTRVAFNGVTVRLNSLRYATFKVSTKCYVCGLEGSYMGLDMGGRDYGHFNLYATKDGVEVLMTKGTKLDPEGYRTTCAHCAKALHPKYNLARLEALRNPIL